MKDWTIDYNNWKPESQPHREALCTLGNGYFATRGAFEENKADKIHYPGTYLAGGYNRAASVIKDKEIVNEDLVNWPNWLHLSFKTEETDWFNIDDVELIDFEMVLNMKEGMLLRSIKFRDKQNRVTRLETSRLVSMDDPHVAAIEWSFTPENWSGEIEVRSGIDGDIENNGVARYQDLEGKHLDILDTGKFEEDQIFLISRTKQAKTRMAQLSSLNFYHEEENIKVSRETSSGSKAIYQQAKVNVQRGTTLRIEKLVALFTSKDFAISDPLTECREKLNMSGNFARIQKKHLLAWEQIWSRSNLHLDSPDNELKVLRLHIFHVHQSVSENSIGSDIGVPSRGWHGEAYRGHIFWDELYIFPYLNLHMPQLARSLLMYRYRRLQRARIMAKENGYRGAMYPWQSGSNGREESQEIHLNPKSGRWIPDNSRLQRHINAAIPYNVWQYYQTTNDMEFLTSYGAEIILNTALFWSCIAEFNEEKGRYEINGVMGPDEYHTKYPNSDKQGLDNNAYTNFMAVWVIRCALNLFNLFDERLSKELIEKVGVGNKDISRWKDIIKKMYIPFIKEDIILQFDGFDQLKDLDWEHYRAEHGEVMRLDRILEKEDDSPNNYRASKQADALMLFYLFSADSLLEIFHQLGYTNFTRDSIPRNIHYYEKITSHGSTLSQVIYAWINSRSDRERSWKNFRRALMSDYTDIQGGTTPEGIHLGAMAGTIDLIQRCYTGLEVRDDQLYLNPRLPKELKDITLHIRYRSHWIVLRINHKKLWVDFSKGWAEPVEISVMGERKLFETNDSAEFDLQKLREKNKNKVLA